MREQPEQHAPPVQRLRIRYAKRGRMRFTSHRDFSRAFERALVRAKVPMAYSSGFNPHPRISYAGAAPTGAASEAEYLEIALAEVTDPDAIAVDLDRALPAGLDVVTVIEADPGRIGGLADRLEASRWRVALPGTPLHDAERAVAAFLATASVPVERMTKKGVRTFDTRAAVEALVVSPDPVPGGTPGSGGTEVEVVLRHTEPAVRPDDVLAGLRQVAGLDVPAHAVMTRLEQGTYDPSTGAIRDPFAPLAEGHG